MLVTVASYILNKHGSMYMYCLAPFYFVLSPRSKGRSKGSRFQGLAILQWYTCVLAMYFDCGTIILGPDFWFVVSTPLPAI